MDDVQTKFITVCSHCSTALRIRRVYAGQSVRCKQCGKTFQAVESDAPGTKDPAEAAEPAAPTTPSNEERIVVACPKCQATLSVRRSYIGHRVRCKQCDETFLVTDPAAPEKPSLAGQPDATDRIQALQADLDRRNQELEAARLHLEAELDRIASVHAEKDRLAAENQELTAAHDRLQSEVGRLASEHDRLREEHDRLRADHDQAGDENQQLLARLDVLGDENRRLTDQLGQANTDLETIRSDLGGLAPADVGPLISERAALSAQAEQLHAELERLRLDLSAREQERSALTNEADLTRIEFDRLRELIKTRDEELESARAERDRLDLDRQRAREETETVRAAMAERERLMQEESDRLREEADQLRREGDRLRVELEDLRRELIEAEQGRRDGIARIEAQLAELAEEHRQLQERHEAAERSRQEQEDRNQALRADLDRLQESPPAPTSSDDLQAARHEVESLRRKLNDSARLERELSELLKGVGIRYREI